MAEAKKILIIEDETIVCKSLQRFLEQHKYRVACISEGISGVEDIRKEKPDLILTDLLLPRLHGFDICRRVKEDNELKDIPLIVMTAVYKGTLHQMEARNLGVADFIEKPLNLDILLKKIKNLIGGGKKKTSPHLVKAIKKQFKDLQEDYVRDLPKKIIRMEELWERIKKRQDTTNQLEELRKLVHSLTGSGSSIGIEEICEYSRRLELMLDMIMTEGEHTIETRKNEIDELLDIMRHHPMVSTVIELTRF
jgi:DNA-binding response OmpR family regulator